MAAAGVSYPLTVTYCPVCGFPPEFCENGPSFDKCKPWLEKNAPHLYPHLFAPAAASSDAAESSVDGAVAGATAAISGLSVADSAPAAGAGGPAKAESAAPAADGKAPKGKAGKGKKAAVAVVISRKDRGRGKCVTIITGLETFDVKLKEAASTLGKKFGCGGTVGKTATGGQEVTIQGDFADELPELLESLYGVPEDAMVVKE
jgi:density-regulated protein DRP1